MNTSNLATILASATPGPWNFQPCERHGAGDLWRDIIADSPSFAPAFVGEAIETDARLICVARNNLPALVEFVEHIDTLIRQSSASYELWNYCVERRGELLAALEQDAGK